MNEVLDLYYLPFGKTLEEKDLSIKKNEILVVEVRSTYQFLLNGIWIKK